MKLPAMSGSFGTRKAITASRETVYTTRSQSLNLSRPLAPTGSKESRKERCSNSFIARL